METYGGYKSLELLHHPTNALIYTLKLFHLKDSYSPSDWHLEMTHLNFVQVVDSNFLHVVAGQLVNRMYRAHKFLDNRLSNSKAVYNIRNRH